MGTILAVKKNKNICIGSDTLTVIAGRKQSSADLINFEKIIKYEANYIGVSGNHSLLLAIKNCLRKDKRKRSFSSEEEIFHELCELHRTLRDEYDFIPEAGNEDSFESSRFELLIVNSYGIFKTYELRSVQHFARFCAIGTGTSYALGAMEALYTKEPSAEKIAKKSLEVAAEFDDATGMPGTFHSIKIL